MKHSATLYRSIQASPAGVFRAISTAGGLQEWCANAAHLEARPGGPFFFWSEKGCLCAGFISEIEADRHLGLDLQSPQAAQIRFACESGLEGVQVSLHLRSEDPLDSQIGFWDPALDNLKAVLETGLDRRIYDRPMLGILIGGLLSAETRERYHSPIDFGIILSGTVAGMGAEALGLLQDDLLFEMNGVQLRDFSALSQALDGLKAGDRADVSWYRVGKKMSGAMLLSGRPQPQLPAGPAELADQVEGLYQRLDAELAEILAGVTEEESAYRPQEREWSIKEILSHAILTERAAQLQIAAAIEGQPAIDWTSNEEALVKALTDVHPTLLDLVAALQATERETVAMLRRLPPELSGRKALIMYLASMLGEHGLPVHTRLHYETIRKQAFRNGRKP